MRTIFVLAAGVAIGVGARAARAQDAVGEPLQVCFDIAADGSAVYPTAVVPARNRQLVAVFHFASGESHRQLVATWIATQIDGAPRHVIAGRTSLNAAGLREGALRFVPSRSLPPGRYRLEVTADGKPWHMAEFTLVGDDENFEPPHSVRDLVPLHKRKLYVYRPVRAGDTTSFSSKMKLGDSVVVAVVAKDGNGVHLHWTHGADVRDEWWRVDDHGAALTKTGAADAKLEPSLMVLPWPLDPPASWSDATYDRTTRIRHEVWGPVPVVIFADTTSGYVSLLTEDTPSGRVSIERQFVPQYGVVRVVQIAARDGRRTSAETLVLARMK